MTVGCGGGADTLGAIGVGTEDAIVLACVIVGGGGAESSIFSRLTSVRGWAEGAFDSGSSRTVWASGSEAASGSTGAGVIGSTGGEMATVGSTSGASSLGPGIFSSTGSGSFDSGAGGWGGTG